MATMTLNEEHHGVELAFDAKPSAGTISALKEHGFRWHSARRVWYARNDEKRLAFSRGICGGEVITSSTEKPEKAPISNKYGVRVGDVFEAVWGYDQTNVDFFQVIALCGAESVRVRQVDPPMLENVATGFMSARRTYRITRELLPASAHSVFIKDQTHGDLKRVREGYGGGVCFKLDTFADARLCTGDSVTTDESWYA